MHIHLIYTLLTPPLRLGLIKREMVHDHEPSMLIILFLISLMYLLGFPQNKFYKCLQNYLGS